MEKSEKRLRLLILFYRLRSRGRSYAEGAQRDSDACPLHLLCKCGVPACGEVRFTPYSFGVAHLNSSVARQRVSLSSGIRMFARGSETRGVSLKSVIFCRARSRIPNHK